jgi:competence protein ComEA
MNDEPLFGTTVSPSAGHTTSWKTDVLSKQCQAEPQTPPRGWPRSTQLATAFLVAALSLALGWQVYSRSAETTRPTRILEGYRFDLNRADAAQLRMLPGVGEVLADRIVQHRREHGDFRSIEDLREVRGIGEVMLARLRQRLYVDPDRARARPADAPSTQPAVAPPTVAGPGSRKVARPVNVNTAGADELQSALPGIGPTLAARIVEARRERPFTSADDLDRVRGIGQVTIEKVRPYVLVGEE